MISVQSAAHTVETDTGRYNMVPCRYSGMLLILSCRVADSADLTDSSVAVVMLLLKPSMVSRSIARRMHACLNQVIDPEEQSFVLLAQQPIDALERLFQVLRQLLSYRPQACQTGTPPCKISQAGCRMSSYLQHILAHVAQVECSTYRAVYRCDPRRNHLTGLGR